MTPDTTKNALRYRRAFGYTGTTKTIRTRFYLFPVFTKTSPNPTTEAAELGLRLDLISKLANIGLDFTAIEGCVNGLTGKITYLKGILPICYPYG